MTMETQDIKNIYNAVCQTPSGTGFFIDHMPDFLYKGDIDDGIPHVHTFYEILWFQEGTGSHFVDFQEYPIHPGTIFFLTPGQVHHFDGSDAYKGVAIKLCTDFMQSRGDDSDLFVKYDLFHTFDTTPYYVVDDGTAAQLQALVESMEEELKTSKDVGHIDMLRSLLKIFLIKVTVTDARRVSFSWTGSSLHTDCSYSSGGCLRRTMQPSILCRSTLMA